jgi:hypothetical protein
MSTQIDQLSTELLHIIFSNLDLSDLRNCRLVQPLWLAICNEYFLPALRTNTTTKLLSLKDSFTQYKVIAGHVRSITIAKKASEEWLDESSATEAQNPAFLGQEITRSRCNPNFLDPFKKLESLTILDGRQFPTFDWHGDFDSDATAEQLETLQPALSNPSVHLRELCVEWVNIDYFQSKVAEIGQSWRSITILRLALTCDDDLSGAGDLSLILRKLSNLSQLHLSTREHGLPLYAIINERKIAWPYLTHLTLRGFVAREPILQKLVSLPRLRSISIARIGLDDDDGCWIRIMTTLRMRKCAEVQLSGWLANDTTTSGWFGDSNEDGSLFEKVSEWLKQGDGEAGSCPLNTNNMDLGRLRRRTTQ